MSFNPESLPRWLNEGREEERRLGGGGGRQRVKGGGGVRSLGWMRQTEQRGGG